MHAKHKLSAAVLGTLLCAAVPAITHAESQSEWFQKQLQITDGYTPDASNAALKRSDGNTSPPDTMAATRVAGPAVYLGTRKEASGGGALIGNPKNYYNGFSPYASDPQYSP